VAERNWGGTGLDHKTATAEILKLGRELLGGRPVLPSAIVSSIGGTKFAVPARVDPSVIAALAELVPLAPLASTAQPRSN